MSAIIYENKFIAEKQAFIKLLIKARMIEITYSETFNLIFSKHINNSNSNSYEWTIRKMNLIIDAPFWVGEKQKWEELRKADNSLLVMDDNMLAYELVNIRYNNLIQVQNIEFFEKYLCITLDNDKVLSIAYGSDSDYSWILEEYSDKNEHEKIAVFCQGNEIVGQHITGVM